MEGKNVTFFEMSFKNVDRWICFCRVKIKIYRLSYHRSQILRVLKGGRERAGVDSGFKSHQIFV